MLFFKVHEPFIKGVHSCQPNFTHFRCETAWLTSYRLSQSCMLHFVAYQRLIMLESLCKCKCKGLWETGTVVNPSWQHRDWTKGNELAFHFWNLHYVSNTSDTESFITAFDLSNLRIYREQDKQCQPYLLGSRWVHHIECFFERVSTWPSFFRERAKTTGHSEAPACSSIEASKSSKPPSVSICSMLGVTMTVFALCSLIAFATCTVWSWDSQIHRIGSGWTIWIFGHWWQQ